MKLLASILSGCLSGAGAGAIFAGGVSGEPILGVALLAIGTGLLCGTTGTIAGLLLLSYVLNRGIENQIAPGQVTVLVLVSPLAGLLIGALLGVAVSHLVSIPAYSFVASAVIGGIAGAIGGLFFGVSNLQIGHAKKKAAIK